MIGARKGIYRITQLIGSREPQEMCFDFSGEGYKNPYWIRRADSQILVIEEMGGEDAVSVHYREFSSPVSWEFIPDE